MDSAVDRRNADETAAMLQLDPSDNLLWRPVVLQDADLDVGVQRCMLKALMRMTGFPCVACRVLVQSMGNGQQEPHCGEAHARWSTCCASADGQSP